jgi:Peptidase family M1 domain/ERAP1-like C-terminal domain/Peptidase M1 N-terminal domain
MGVIKYLLTTMLLGALISACGDASDGPAGADIDTADILAENEADNGQAMLSLPGKPPSARLPEGVAPTHYRIHLDIDPRKERFSGSVSIAIELSAPSTFLWLHGLDLDVTSAIAITDQGERIELRWEQASSTGVAKVSADAPIPAGKASLQFDYTAPFNNSLEGLYKVEQGDDAYAYTQFESTSARLAFPSFDEPGFKVPFDISLSVPIEHLAITNSPQTSEVAGPDGRKTLEFATTKPLPTYLIAFAVGPFDVLEWEAIPRSNLRDRPVPMRGITTRGKAGEIRYALENTAFILAGLEEYFDTPYPYAKLDIIAVPDFSAGAMENAGAITYREQLILLDENASVNQKRSFFGTHTHELAHQWFGNLVTPVWWDDIWLNESFATWNSYIVLDKLYPEENYRETLKNRSSGVMRNDSLASARQIREPIERHEDIGSAFNGITYLKGGGVLSMFESFLGTDQFREGIRQYMKTFAWGNTTADDFISAIADANPQVEGEDLRAAFFSYIEQPGLPIISTSLHCDENGAQLNLSQRRYLPAGSDGSTDQTWTIPVCMSSLEADQSSSQCFLLKEKTQTVKLNSETCPQAILPNTGGSSYYRWSLPPQQWQSLLAKFEQLDTGEQISVANSLSAALNDGSMNLQDYLAAVPVITRSNSWRVAMAPRADLYKIKEFLADDDERLELEAKLRQWYQPQLDRLEAISERRPQDDQFHRLVMSTLALGAHDPNTRATLDAASVAFTGYGGDEQLRDDAVDPNLRLIALLVGVEEHGKPFVDLLWRHFQASDNALLKQHLLIAMADSTDPVVAGQMRDRILSPELKDNEIFSIFGSQMSRKENRQAMWDWSQENMWAILERIPAWRKGQIPARFTGFCSREQANDIENFFSPIIETLSSGPRYLANSLETIRLCAAFVDLHGRPETP